MEGKRAIVCGIVGLSMVGGFAIPVAAQTCAAPGTFLATTPMSVPRGSHVAQLLVDGRVLLAGSDEFTTHAEVFDPVWEAPIQTGSLNVGRCYGCGTTSLQDGRIMVAGGWNRRSVLNSVELYDPSTGAFQFTGSMVHNRLGPNVHLLRDGQVIAIAGHTGFTPRASAELFDPVTGLWSLTGSMSMPRLGVSVVLRDDRVLVIGGQSNTGAYLSSAEVYDPASGMFSMTGSMTHGRHGHAALVLSDGRVLVVGGAGQSAPALKSAELYDPASGSFETVADMTTTRVGAGLILLHDGRAMVIGGWDGGGWDGANPLTSTEIFDPVTRTFTPGPSMLTARSGFGLTTLTDGRVLISGGYGPNGTRLAAMEFFAPCIPVNDAPRLLLGGPYAAYAGTPVALSAAATDPEGDATSIQWDLDGDGIFEADGGQQLMFAPPTSIQVAVRAIDVHGAVATGAVQIIVVSTDPHFNPGPIDPYFEPRPSFIEWDAVVGGLRADYGPRFEPDQLATTCAVASRMLGHIPLWRVETSGFLGLKIEITPNYSILVDMQRALPAEFKYVGLGYAAKCVRLPIPDGADLAGHLGISVDCAQISALYTELTGETPEVTLANALPISEQLKEIIRTRLVICPFSLNLSGYNCEQKIQIAAELAELALPGLGLLLNSPVGKFIANALLCGIDIDIPDLSFEFPEINWGSGRPGCWFGCGSGGDGSGGDGDSGSGSGGGGFNWGRVPSFGAGDWDWTTVPPAPPTGPGNYVDCALLPADWRSMSWRQLVEFGAARGSSAMTMMDLLAACTLTEPAAGLPFRSDAAVALSGPSNLQVGDVAVYELSVRTAGPGDASLSRVLVTAVTPFEVLSPDASCRNVLPTTARCDFGNVTVGVGRTIALAVRFAAAGTGLLRAGLVSYVADQNLADNTATLSVIVEKRVPSLSWTPEALGYGAPIGAAQLNAVADIAGTFSYSPAAGAILGAGTHTLSVTFTPTDAAKYLTVTRDAVVTVIPASLTVTAPTLSREFGTDTPPLSATVTGFVNGDDVSDLSGTLSVSTTATVTSPVGSYPVVASGVTSSNYEVGFVAGTLTVVDTTAPVIASATPSETTLWAPNHRMVPITLSVIATDATGVASCRVIGVSSNEPINGTGDGDVAPDWAITGPLSVQLRAERSGAGSGRVYTVRVQCEDNYGNASSASTTVTVPHSRK